MEKIISFFKKSRFLKPVIPAAVVAAVIAVALSGYEAPAYKAKTPEISLPDSNDTAAPALTLPDTAALPDEARAEGTPSSGAISTLDSVDDSGTVYQDGTYTGTAQGFGGPITVSVTVTGGKISDIAILSAADETPEYLNRAKGVISSILSGQSTNVDVVSGATYSSNGIIQAVRNALSKASGSSASGSPASSVSASSSAAAQTARTAAASAAPVAKQDESNDVWQDGTYTGTAQGYGGPITVSVTVSGHKITKITVTGHSGETPAFYALASVLPDRIISLQSTNVDVISGATYSSNGIINAVRNALRQSIGDNSAPDTASGDSDRKNTGSATRSKPEDTTQDPDETAPDPASPETGGDAPSDADGDDEAPVTVIKLNNIWVTDNPDPDGDYFFDYYLKMNVEIQDGRIINIRDIKQNDNPDMSTNEHYVRMAVDGSGSDRSVIAQIIEKGVPENIDVVSGATYTSNALIEAAKEALEKAGTH